MTHGLPFSGFFWSLLIFKLDFGQFERFFFEELFNQWRRYFSSKKCWKSSFNMIASVVVLPSEPVKGESNGSRCWHCLLQCLGEAVSRGQINAPIKHVFWMIFLNKSDVSHMGTWDDHLPMADAGGKQMQFVFHNSCHELLSQFRIQICDIFHTWIPSVPGVKTLRMEYHVDEKDAEQIMNKSLEMWVFLPSCFCRMTGVRSYFTGTKRQSQCILTQCVLNPRHMKDLHTRFDSLSSH